MFGFALIIHIQWIKRTIVLKILLQLFQTKINLYNFTIRQDVYD